MNLRNGLLLVLTVAACGLPLITSRAADVVASPDTLTIAVPSAVRATIVKEGGSASVAEFRRDHDGNVVHFVAGVMIDDKPYDITVDDAGKLLSKNINEDHFDEVAASTGEVKADALPEAVKATLDREVHGGAVNAARVSYVVRAVVDESTYKMKFSGDGTLLSKELEDDGQQ